MEWDPHTGSPVPETTDSHDPPWPSPPPTSPHAEKTQDTFKSLLILPR